MGVEYEKYCRDLRKIMLLMLSNGKSGHIGGSLSVLESLAFVYREFIKGSKNKLVYSKGHCELAIYSILFKEGIIQKYWIDKLKKFGSVLQGHPSCSWISELDYS